jgi:hypothetical protein
MRNKDHASFLYLATTRAPCSHQKQQKAGATSGSFRNQIGQKSGRSEVGPKGSSTRTCDDKNDSDVLVYN